jgi:hypothetical protein
MGVERTGPQAVQGKPKTDAEPLLAGQRPGARWQNSALGADIAGSGDSPSDGSCAERPNALLGRSLSALFFLPGAAGACSQQRRATEKDPLRFKCPYSTGFSLATARVVLLVPLFSRFFM